MLDDIINNSNHLVSVLKHAAEVFHEERQEDQLDSIPSLEEV